MPKTLKAAGKIKNICELSGLVLGVDIEVWLHKGMQTADAAVLHCQEPPVPIPNGVAIVGARNRRLHENGIEPVYVFGGSKHTGKAPVDATGHGTSQAFTSTSPGEMLPLATRTSRRSR